MKLRARSGSPWHGQWSRDPEAEHRISWLGIVDVRVPVDSYLLRPSFARAWDVPSFLPGTLTDHDRGDILVLHAPIDDHDSPLSEMHISQGA